MGTSKAHAAWHPCATTAPRGQLSPLLKSRRKTTYWTKGSPSLALAIACEAWFPSGSAACFRGASIPAKVQGSEQFDSAAIDEAANNPHLFSTANQRVRQTHAARVFKTLLSNSPTRNRQAIQIHRVCPEKGRLWLINQYPKKFVLEQKLLPLTTKSL